MVPVVKNFKEKWFQHGIVAWGIACGKAGKPGIYTRVGKYITWILTSMTDF